LFEISLNIDVEYLYENEISCLSCDKIFDRPVELSGVERLASPLNLTLPVFGLNWLDQNSNFGHG
jgi:hypothetical protein